MLEELRAHGWPGTGSSELVTRVALAGDASHYLLTPQAVLTPASEAEMAQLLRAADRAGVPLTFRSGGTSLSGQSVTDGALVDTRRGFRGLEVLDEGRLVRVGPGTTIGAVNAALAPYGTKVGPDPASEAACTVGGVVANNSSGMSCGTHANPYATLASLRLVLPGGEVVDTGEPDADDRLRARRPDLHRGLLALRDRVRSDPAMVTRIRSLFAIKNTMGYAVNAFLDFDAPADILAHLVVGSEGTLAFVASATFRTVPAYRHASAGLMVLPDLAAATEALPGLIATDAAVIELLDVNALRVAQGDRVAPAFLRDLQLQGHAALLVEYQAGTADELAARVDGARRATGWLADAAGGLAQEATGRAALWKIRKGLYAAVAGARRPGTTALLEDVAVPVPALPATCAGLDELFTRHGYDGSVIFGHAKDGNLHFMLTEDFAAADGVRRYAAFTEDMVDLILGHDGTLKAEHGTGRVMAGYVRRQYGDDLYDVMRQAKRLCDPRGVLGPGVVLSNRDLPHLEHLKVRPAIEEEAERCVECGFCEPVCPSRDLTLTPRQRIIVKRAIAQAEQDGDSAARAELVAGFEYAGVQTCAVDGMCQTRCPVEIDTGSLVRRLRAEGATPLAQAGGRTAARHWAGTTRTAARALTVARRAPAVAGAATRVGRKVIGEDVVPSWTPDLPAGGRRRRGWVVPDAQVVYFPSCTDAMFAAESGRSLAAVVTSLCEKAGVPISVARDIDGLCCATPWSSKGLSSGAELMRGRLREALGDPGARIVVDASSCTEGLRKTLGEGPVEDAVTFAVRTLLPRLHVQRSEELIALHPTCASVLMQTDGDLRALADALSTRVFVPPSWGCCGFAGDRGMLHPELTESATRQQAGEVIAAGADEHVSCNRTCELGMSRAVGRPYRHILELLDERSSATC